MSYISVTNIKASQALRGESVIVTLDPSEYYVLDELYVGQKIEISSTQDLGIIHSIDVYGHSFVASPIQLNLTLESLDTPGYLKNGETIYIYVFIGFLLQEDGSFLLQEDGYEILL